MTDELEMDYSMESCSEDAVQMLIKPEREVCFGCGEMILERYLLKVGSRSWHVHCLRCTSCQSALVHHTTCFIREENIYCKIDYSRQFGTKCAKCSRSIQSTDWIRRAKEHVYHLACFACDSCKRQLSTGEEFALHDHRVLCKAHYVELIEGGGDSDSDQHSQRSKTKRVRTTFTEEQLQVLQANFQLDSNPDGQDLERIAQITGLSKRVTQVWFQNSRARQKKHQQQNHNNNNNIHNMSMSPDSDMPPLPSSSPLSHSGGMASPASTGHVHAELETMFTHVSHSPTSETCPWQTERISKGEVFAS